MDASTNSHPPDILAVPENVIFDYIFPNLRLNDLLRLRRTCKHIKNIADDFIRSTFTYHEREINEDSTLVRDYIARDFPTCRIYINNSGPAFFEDPSLPEFLSHYGHHITHLRVHFFSGCVSPAENLFFCGLPNLLHLELEVIDATDRKTEYFPPNFENLLTLKLNKILGTHKGDLDYAWDFIEFCPKLEYLCHPDVSEIAATSESGFLGVVHDYIGKRERDYPDEPNLKYYDLQHLPGEFLEVLPIMFYYGHDVKLLNVDALPYDSFFPTNRGNFHKFVTHIVSLKNFNGFMLWIDLPLLEKLVITGTSMCTFKRAWYDEVPRWPSLHTLDINIDSEHLKKTSYLDKKPTSAFLDFLFGAVKRPNLVDLAIRFDKQSSAKDHLPCPRVTAITRKCENVKKLTLTNWLGTNKQISKLWKGLVHLEEVVLEECKELGLVAFQGEHKEDPCFLKLRNLRKFTLNGLEKMPQINDNVFTMVFRHLTVEQFHLTSGGRITTVTMEGIRSLLTGDFKFHVEKFPFTGWSLENVSEEEFAQLKSEFRSSYML